MTVGFTATNAAVAVQPIDIISAALIECGVLAQGESPNPDDSAWMLQKLQRLTDQWNANRDKIFTLTFQVYTLLTNTQPISIGPGGQFPFAQRPVKLESCALILNNTSATQVDIPVWVQDADWWADQRIKNLTSTLCTNVYYSPDNPLGNLYFWPIPTVANQVRLEMWVGLTQALDLVTPLQMPQAYWDAIVYTLAVSSCPSFGRPVSPDLRMLQKEAVESITQNNAQSPRISTAEAGIPQARRRPGFNFLSGEPW